MRILQLRMSASFVLAATAIGLVTPPCFAQRQLWMRQFGTSESDYAGAVVTDGDGGSFVGGATTGALAGLYLGGWDAFIARYDEQGNELWIRQFGTVWSERGDALAPDGTGGVYAAGSAGSQSASGTDIYLTHWDSAGTELKTTQFGSSEFDYVGAIALDVQGSVFMCGRTAGDLGGPYAGGSDAFVARFDAELNPVWIVQFGEAKGDWANALVADDAGGVFVGGWMDGEAFGAADAFIARYDGTGERLWLRRFGSSGNWDSVSAVIADTEGGVIIAGITEGIVDGVNLDEHDAFIARYDGAGNQLWIRQFGTLNHDGASALAMDGAGGAIVAGQIDGTHGGLLDPWFGSVMLARYDRSGNQVWLRQIGTGLLNNNWASALSFDQADQVTVAGYTEDSLGGPHMGEGDAFVARFSTQLCLADCDQSTGIGVLDIVDFLCFQNSFVSSEPYACDCDTSTGNGVCDVFDFLCFQNAFVGGCP